MSLRPVRRPGLVSLLVLAGLPGPARAEPPAPEVQACLLSLRDGERARAEAALGPLEALPFLQADLAVEPDAGNVRGRVTLLWTPRQPTGFVELRLTPNAFGRSLVRLSLPRINGEPGTLVTLSDDLLRVNFPRPVGAAEAVRLEVQLSAQVPRAAAEDSALSALQLSGRGERTDHGAFSARDDAVSLVGIVPRPPLTTGEGARGEGPTGIGDLALYDPANVLVEVTVPAPWRAVAGGVALGETPAPGGGTRYRFGIAAARDVVLLVTRGYRRARREVAGVTLESSVPEPLGKAGERLLAQAAELLGALERRLGPTPYRTLRVVAAPLTGGAGGMEFPGLLTVSTPLLRLAEDPGKALGLPGLELLPGSGEALGSLVEFALAHELAHQWFPALVGSDPIAAPVVDEALAQAVALLAVEWTAGAAAAQAVDAVQVSGAYRMWRALGGRDAAADRPTSAFTDELTYAALVYGKAPGLHARQRALLGDAAFLADLRAYVETHRWGWADSGSLTSLLARRHPERARELRELQRRWWSEAHGDEDLGGAGASLVPALPSEEELDRLLRQLER